MVGRRMSAARATIWMSGRKTSGYGSFHLGFGMAFAESRPARHSQSSRIRFTRAMTFGATWFTHLLRPARLLAPQYGSDHLRGQRGLLLPGFQRVRPVAGYDCSSDWTPLLAGLSPARMTASLAAPTPSS